MQLVSIQNRMLRIVIDATILFFLVAPLYTMKFGVSEPLGEKMVNDTVIMRSASPVSRDQPSLPNETGHSERGLVCLFEITAYSPTVAECDASPFITASGQKVHVGGIAADLNVLPFGSLVIIPGYNNNKPCEVIDTGGAISGNKLDVFFWLSDEAVHWGRRHNVPVTVLRIGHGD